MGLALISNGRGLNTSHALKQHGENSLENDAISCTWIELYYYYYY